MSMGTCDVYARRRQDDGAMDDRSVLSRQEARAKPES